jgi:hypothetical protein
LIDRVHQVAAQAATALRRRGTLRDEIKMEFGDRNYEQVRKLIVDYNGLVFDNEFADMESKLDDLQCIRDLERLREAVRLKHWDYAKRLAEELNCSAGESRQEADRLYKKITLRYKYRRYMRRGGVVLIIFLLYIFSGAPVYRMWGRPERGVFYLLYAPLSWVQKSTIFSRPLTAYARNYDAADMFE